VKKNRLVTYIFIDGEDKIIEFEVSGDDEEQITAFLAEVGDRMRKELVNRNIITPEDHFYDMRISVISHVCPYCGERIPDELIQGYLGGTSIQCKYCGVKIIRHEG